MLYTLKILILVQLDSYVPLCWVFANQVKFTVRSYWVIFSMMVATCFKRETSKLLQHNRVAIHLLGFASIVAYTYCNLIGNSIPVSGQQQLWSPLLPAIPPPYLHHHPALAVKTEEAVDLVIFLISMYVCLIL